MIYVVTNSTFAKNRFNATVEVNDPYYRVVDTKDNREICFCLFEQDAARIAKAMSDTYAASFDRLKSDMRKANDTTRTM